MYPQEELTSLAASKAALRQRISTRRAECAAAAARVARPIAWIDRAYAGWRSLSPLVRLAAVPIGILMGRLKFPQTRVAGALLRWGPLVLGAVRSLALQQGLSGRD